MQSGNGLVLPLYLRWQQAQTNLLLHPTLIYLMTIHKEGTASIIITAVICIVLGILTYTLLGNNIFFWIVAAALLILFLFIVSFFRLPKREFTKDDSLIVSPCDGKVVVIEETEDPEFFKGKCLQVSIFMSPANVHVNWVPVNGSVIYNQYHKGKYLVAWHPKSSTENERHSIVIEKEGRRVLVKQIAGALAKRIVNYTRVGQQVTHGQEMGFIKFGSRVDLLLPVGTEIKVSLNEVVQGGTSIIGTLK